MITFAPWDDRAIDLFQKVEQGLFRGQRTQCRLLVQRVPWFESRKRRLKLLQEFVGKFVDDDEPLRRAAGLSRIVHPSPHRPLDGVFEIGVFEDNERVAAAEFHRGRLEVLSGSCRDASAGRDAAGQRHAFDSRVIDDAVRLIVRDQKVGVQTDGRARLDQKLLEGDRALRHDACVLHQHDVARHQMRTGDPGKLVVGKVPGLHAEDHADRAALHMAFAETRMQLHRRQEALGVLGVIGEDVRAELHLAAGFADPLAHFERHRVRELVGLRMHDRCSFGDDDRSLGISLLPPSLKASCGGGDLGLELFVRQLIELFQKLSGGGVEALVGHGLFLFQCCRAGGGVAVIAKPR